MAACEMEGAHGGDKGYVAVRLGSGSSALGLTPLVCGGLHT